MDFGGTTVTGMHALCVERLRAHYGLERRPVQVHVPYNMLGFIEEDLADAMGLDIAGVLPRNTIYGYPNEHWKEFRTPWGQEVLISGHFQFSIDANGDLLTYPQGDPTAPPSGRMPPSSFFFDTIVRQPDIDDDRLNPEDNLQEFGPLSEADTDHFRQAVAAATATGRAVVVAAGGTGFGDIALVPAPGLKYPKGIRDVAEWYVSLATRQAYVEEVFARQCEIALQRLAQLHAAVGNAVDIVYLCGTDFGTQSSRFCSLETFDRLWAPHYRRINEWVHAHTSWKTMKHTCGAVEPLLSRLIDVGFDIFNPVQCSAAGMEPCALKRNYGDRLVFYGGGVNTQHTLPFGTPEEVRAEVLERCDIFSRGGGYIFNTVHCVQANTPVENVVAMLDAVREFNGVR
ncbi:MAG: methyltransferase [Zetaproteobacteria bacterium]|nr:MAG: methyltransferase [Zetaproteobacteria bacterium]